MRWPEGAWQYVDTNKSLVTESRLVPNTRPFTEAHAIACVDVAVMYRSEVPDFLNSDFSREIGAHLQTLGFKRGKARKSALTWRLRAQDGARLQEAHLHAGFMHVSAYDYRGWSNSRDEIFRALSPLLDMCATGRVHGVASGLAFVDVFINDSGSEYRAEDVFSTNSEVISKTLFAGGPSWRQDIAWYPDQGDDLYAKLTAQNRRVEPEDEDDAKGEPQQGADGRPLSVPKFVTEISLRLSLGRNSDRPDHVEWSEAEFKVRLNRLHAINKSIMSDLLNEEMSRTIGLKE